MRVLLRWIAPTANTDGTEGLLVERTYDTADVFVTNTGNLQISEPSSVHEGRFVDYIIPSSWIEEISYSV